ncbi:hypothetical protein CMUS01_14590 [Colletotrichum musicola]|uniref:Uncharacterized protein n=1 Tax=Colletotrichum musicola TaxID=2175873 RepID=A0A8H6J329_9PEZI|nr:hypothetical protein CMUS01_14590 [Colletotrichum musicola]
MRTNTFSILTLAAMLKPALCIKQATVIRTPECAANGHGTAKNIGESKSSSCQDAILSLYGRGAEILTGPTSGCDRIVSSDPCDLFLCAGDNGSQGRISAGALVIAAQDIHTYCRLNGKVGGRVAVVPPGGKPDGSLIVQIGEIPKDELKVRDAGDLTTGQPSAAELRARAPSTLSMRRFRRSDQDEGLVVTDAVKEGEDGMVLDFVDLQNLGAELFNDVVRVQNQPNPDWTNSAMAQVEHTDDAGPFTVTMAFLGHDGRTIADLGNDNQGIDDMIQTSLAHWMNQRLPLPPLFSMTVFRQFRNARDEEYLVPLGDIVINAARGTDVEGFLSSSGGSSPT